MVSSIRTSIFLETNYSLRVKEEETLGKEIQIFNNPEFGDVRVMDIEGEPWLVGKDVAEKLGYADTFGALKKHVDDEDKQNCQNDSFESPRGMTIINESGLYSLVLSSKLPTAKKFKRWVTSEVLPQIRKTGSYSKPLSPEEQMAQGLLAAQKLLDQTKLELTQAKQLVCELQPKATYYDLVLQNKSLLSVTKIAKDYGKSAIWLNTKLHEYGIQFKQGDQWFLYQKYAQNGYTQSDTHVIDDKHSRMNTKWTQKGRLFIYATLKEHNILPLIEMEDA